MQRLYVIDGFNLLHAAILKGRDRRSWWKADNQRRVLDLVERFLGAGTLVIVFDAARGPKGPEEGRIGSGMRAEVRYAASADEEIVRICGENAGRLAVNVVSADRALVDRCRARGAERFSPFAFAEQCARERSEMGSSDGALYKRGAASDTRSNE